MTDKRALLALAILITLAFISFAIWNTYDAANRPRAKTGHQQLDLLSKALLDSSRGLLRSDKIRPWIEKDLDGLRSRLSSEVSQNEKLTFLRASIHYFDANSEDRRDDGKTAVGFLRSASTEVARFIIETLNRQPEPRGSEAKTLVLAFRLLSMLPLPDEPELNKLKQWFKSQPRHSSLANQGLHVLTKWNPLPEFIENRLQNLLSDGTSTQVLEAAQSLALVSDEKAKPRLFQTLKRRWPNLDEQMQTIVFKILVLNSEYAGLDAVSLVEMASRQQSEQWDDALLFALENTSYYDGSLESRLRRIASHSSNAFLKERARSLLAKTARMPVSTNQRKE